MQPEYETPREIESATGIESVPDVPTPPEKRVWGFWATVGFALAIGALSIMAQAVLLIGLMFSNLEPSAVMDPLAIEDYFNANLGYILSLATFISAILGTVGIIGVIKIRRGASVKEYLGLRRISLKTLALVILLTLVLIVVIDGFSIVFDQTLETDFDTQMYRTSIWPVLIWLAVVIFAPLHEEVLFRGFLFAGLRHSRLGTVGAIVITALVWASLHTQYDLYVMGNIFVLGLVFGIVRYKTKSLWSALSMHFVYNLVAMILIALNVESIFG